MEGYCGVWFVAVICCDPDKIFLLSEGSLELWWGHPFLVLRVPWVRSIKPWCLEWGSESACGSFPCLPPSPQGDIQELLISPDPQAAFHACEQYLLGCDRLGPTTTGVSERLVLKSQA